MWKIVYLLLILSCNGFSRKDGIIIANDYRVCPDHANSPFHNRNSWLENTIEVMSGVASGGVGAIISKFGISNETLEWVADSLVDAALGPPPPVPRLPLHKWWGVDNGRHREHTAVYPFKIKFDKNMVEDLLFRIRNRNNFTRPLRGAANTYGFNADTLDAILEYWQREYDFSAAEAYVNRYPHYMTNIQGLDIHFVHIKPAVWGKRVLPILVLHGWPSHVREAYSFYPLLTEPRDGYDYVFEVVAPDLPGFGFSEGTTKQGLAPYQVAIILRNLMRRLGHAQFYVQGGDFGAITGSDMSVLFPEEVLGFHTNLPYSLMPKTLVKTVLGAFYPDAVVEPEYADRMYPLSKHIITYLRETGYWHEQATKPDSIGVGLQDSPSALAAYVLEKFLLGKDLRSQCLADGGLPHAYRIEDLLDILTLIWSSKSITTSMRYYAETMAALEDATEAIIQLFIPSRVPYAAIKFRHEIIYQPDGLLRDKYPNLVDSRTLSSGGHFAPLESAHALADHVWHAAARFLHFHTSRQ